MILLRLLVSSIIYCISYFVILWFHPNIYGVLAWACTISLGLNLWSAHQEAWTPKGEWGERLIKNTWWICVGFAFFYYLAVLLGHWGAIGAFLLVVTFAGWKLKKNWWVYKLGVETLGGAIFRNEKADPAAFLKKLEGEKSGRTDEDQWLKL
jgi:hypothetical protein